MITNGGYSKGRLKKSKIQLLTRPVKQTGTQKEIIKNRDGAALKKHAAELK
jgi:hypothetical protein